MTNPPPYNLGVVIGKFLSPHKGHRFLIETALSHCRRVVVIVCEKPTDPIPGELRAAWLRELIPTAEVMLIDDRYDENDSRIWAENTIRWLGRAPDAVFTSESYGDAYATHLGCVHVSVDPARMIMPCSGTAVRDDPFAMWHYIGFWDTIRESHEGHPNDIDCRHPSNACTLNRDHPGRSGLSPDFSLS